MLRTDPLAPLGVLAASFAHARSLDASPVCCCAACTPWHRVARRSVGRRAAVLASVLPPGVTPLHVFVYASALLLLALLVCADAAMRWFVAQQRGLAALVEEVFMEPAAGGAQGGGQQTAAADKAPYLSVVGKAWW